MRLLFLGSYGDPLVYRLVLSHEKEVTGSKSPNLVRHDDMSILRTMS